MACCSCRHQQMCPSAIAPSCCSPSLYQSRMTGAARNAFLSTQDLQPSGPQAPSSLIEDRNSKQRGCATTLAQVSRSPPEHRRGRGQRKTKRCWGCTLTGPGSTGQHAVPPHPRCHSASTRHLKVDVFLSTCRAQVQLTLTYTNTTVLKVTDLRLSGWHGRFYWRLPPMVGNCKLGTGGWREAHPTPSRSSAAITLTVRPLWHRRCRLTGGSSFFLFLLLNPFHVALHRPLLASRLLCLLCKAQARGLSVLRAVCKH